jgi:hypothetical protein
MSEFFRSLFSRAASILFAMGFSPGGTLFVSEGTFSTACSAVPKVLCSQRSFSR